MNDVQSPQTYVTPRAILRGAAADEAVAANKAWPLAGDKACAAIDVFVRADGEVTRLGLFTRDTFGNGLSADVRAAVAAQIEALALPCSRFAGLSLQQSLIMGVLNVTPDSFSDGGLFTKPEAAVAHARGMMEDGASLIDVGGESTRPGAAAVSEARELDRVIDVVKALYGRGIAVSIDTRRPKVMVEALKAGARIVNDVTALSSPEAIDVVVRANASVVLMHMQGDPATMQEDPQYVWAPGDVYDYLAARVAACVAAGIPKERIAVDPGIGFGKNDIHNAQIMDHLGMFHGLGCALVVGVSRKSFIGRMSRGEPATLRLPGSLAAGLHAAAAGAHILRVHDVPETKQALAVAERLWSGN